LDISQFQQAEATHLFTFAAVLTFHCDGESGKATDAFW